MSYLVIVLAKKNEIKLKGLISPIRVIIFKQTAADRIFTRDVLRKYITM